MPSLLKRHPWTAKFEQWLNENKLTYRNVPIARAAGISNGILLGKPEDSLRSNVIFFHGLGNDMFFPNILFFKMLLTSGFNILAVDLDGHGVGQKSIFSLESLKTLIATTIDTLGSKTASSTKPHLCGFSFGAALCLSYVKESPETVASVTMIGMPGQLKASPKLLAEALSPTAASWWRALNDYGFSGIHPAVGSFRRELYPVRLADGEKRSYLEVAGSILRLISAERLLSDFKIPTLGISGDLDFIALRDPTATIIGQKNLHWRTIRRANHFTTMLSPETARIVCDFLRTRT